MIGSGTSADSYFESLHIYMITFFCKKSKGFL